MDSVAVTGLLQDQIVRDIVIAEMMMIARKRTTHRIMSIML